MEEKIAGGKFLEIPFAVDIIFAGGKISRKIKIRANSVNLLNAKNWCYSTVYFQSCQLSALLPFPGTTMSIIFLEMLCSSLVLICPYQFNIFWLRNVEIWHTLASSCMLWFLTWSCSGIKPILSYHPNFCYMQSILVFLSNRPTLCSKCHCWLDHRLIHIVFQFDGYLYVA